MSKEESYVYDDDEIDILQLFLVIWAKKKIILILLIPTIIITLIVSIKLYPIQRTVKKDFFLNFSGIENYKNPDGTSFHKEQIIKPLILKNAYNKLKNQYPKLPFSYDYLHKNIYIKEVIPEKIKKEEKKKGEQIYYTNHFELYINRLDDDKIYSKILYEVLLQYKMYFKNYYTKNLYFANIPQNNLIEKYDYIDLINIIKSNIKSMQTFLDANLNNSNNSNNKVINSKYFMECYNIYNTNQLIGKNLDLTVTEIEQNYITKDSIFYIQKLKEEIKQKQLKKNIEKAKLDGANKILKNLTSIAYAKPINNLNKETNFSLNGDFIEKQVQNNYYSFLIKNILDYTVKYKQLTAEIKFLKNKLNSWKLSSNNNKKKNNLKLTSKLLSLIDEYNQNVNKLNDILNISFEEKFIDNIIFTSADDQYRNVFNKKVIINTIVAGFCILFITIFLIFFNEMLENNKEKKKTLLDKKYTLCS